MTICIVSISDTEWMALSIDYYLKSYMKAGFESYFMTYRRCLLSNKLFHRADLFILELFRRDDIGFRTEAIYAGERWSILGKKVLIVSGDNQSNKLDVDFYWDLSATDFLHERIMFLLTHPTPTRNFSKLKDAYSYHCRPCIDRHFLIDYPPPS